MSWFGKKRKELRLEVIFNQLAFLHQELLDGNAKEIDDLAWKNRLEEATVFSFGMYFAGELTRKYQQAYEQFEVEILRKGEKK